MIRATIIFQLCLTVLNILSAYGPFRDAAGSAPSFGDRKLIKWTLEILKEFFREIEADEAKEQIF